MFNLKFHCFFRWKCSFQSSSELRVFHLNISGSANTASVISGSRPVNSSFMSVAPFLTSAHDVEANHYNWLLRLEIELDKHSSGVTQNKNSSYRQQLTPVKRAVSNPIGCIELLLTSRSDEHIRKNIFYPWIPNTPLKADRKYHASHWTWDFQVPRDVNMFYLLFK